MKKITLTLALIVAFVATSNAQFFGSKPIAKEVVTSASTIATTASLSNNVAASVGKNGFAVTTYLVGTNAGTANINVQAYVSHDGTSYSTAPIILGDVAMNGTTPVRKTIFVPPTTIGNVAAVKLVLTNAHTAGVTISNVSVTSFQ